MSEAIVVAIVSGGLSLVGVIITVVLTNKKGNADLLAEIKRQSEISDQKLDAKLERNQAVTDTKLDELTREVRRHNEFAERIPKLEQKVSDSERRITDLEHKA